MPIRDLKDQIARLPEQPGVYLFLNGAGETIYAGKARVLRDRVRSYLVAYGGDPKRDALLDEAEQLQVIVTDSVMEALALENNLIKERTPKYNILLRDDKNYPYLQLTIGESFPRLLVARHIEQDGHAYYGPFLPASLARRTIELSHRLFGLRSCNETITGNRGRPCLEYDIHRCIAPCVAAICSADQYQRAVTDARLFLEGRRDELLDDLRSRMREAAVAERFEQAAQLRDAIRTIETLRDRQQKMATARLGDRDAFGLRIGPERASVHVFQVRNGRVVDRIELATDVQPIAAASEAEVVGAAIQQFYEVQDPPSEVHVPVLPQDADVLEAWLSARAGRRVRILVPKRGEKRGLLDLATRNAGIAYEARANERGVSHYDALEGLRTTLGLSALPRRIECFDISTIQGSETVASMVVCEDGRMRRSEYRKYRIKGIPVDLPSIPGFEASGDAAGSESSARFQDDFAAMHEVVLRRYQRAMQTGGPFPDLILIDGGKGQLSAAYQALERLGLERLVAIGLAKQEELIVTRESADPIALPRESPALRLLQRIRDEAHRFALTFHRRARAMRDLRSELDVIPGVGPRRRRALLVTFGSVAGVRRATREELTPVVGPRAADAILEHFQGVRSAVSGQR
jgi:excinuclease ABC subunit C